MVRVVIFDTNLITSSKVANAVRSCGLEVEKFDMTMTSSDGSGDRVFVINLESPRGIDVLKRVKDLDPRPKVIAYCGHKNTDLIEEAQSLGADLVVPNSAIVSRVCELIRDLY